MKEQLHKNVRILRKEKKITQEEMAKKLKIKRSLLGAYEEGRAKPRLDVMQRYCQMFGISMEELIYGNLEKAVKKATPKKKKEIDIHGGNMRVLSITVDSDDNENIELVPMKASAGYLNGYADPTYLEELPKFRLPFMPPGTYRAFEIKGDSMLPLSTGSIIIGEYITNWEEIKSGETYVVVSNTEGVVYKRLENKIAMNKTIVCKSDNPSYPPFAIDIDEVIEIWQAKTYISSAFPTPELNMQRLNALVLDMQQQIVELKDN